MIRITEPTRAQKRAWARKKQNDRDRAAYRNGLPTSLTKLRELLAAAKSPWYAELIQARIEQVQAHNRHSNHKRRAREAAARAQAERDNDARLR